MNRVLLKDIATEDEIAQQTADSKSEDNDLKINKTYEEALNLFLAPKRTPPRRANDDDEKVLLELINSQPNQNIMEYEEISTLTDAMDQNSINTNS